MVLLLGVRIGSVKGGGRHLWVSCLEIKVQGAPALQVRDEMKAQELHLGEVGLVRVPWAPTRRLGAGGLTGWLHCCRSGRGRQKNAWVVPWGDGEGHPPPRSIHGDSITLESANEQRQLV